MYSYEERLRAVQLHIKLGKRIGLTIRQLGYESAQVEHGGKWAPVKVHRKAFTNGIGGEA